MYSRTPNPPYRGHQMGRREPSYRRMNGLPPNYSGTAFSTAEPSVVEELPRRPEDDTTPRFDGLPQVSRLPQASRLPQVSSLPMPVETTAEPTAAVEAESAMAPKTEDVSPTRSTGLFSFLDGHHFPFGHGIGYEELLLLGLIFFLMKECDGEGDLNETLILLGLLLLGG